MTDAVASLFDFLTNPVVGIPALILTAGTIAWAAMRPRPLAPLEPARHREAPPSDDAVSRIQRAVESQSNSILLEAAWSHLDTEVRRRYRLGIEEVPWLRGRARRRGIPRPGPLRAARSRLRSLHGRAITLEIRPALRLDFFRSRAKAQRHLANVVDRTLVDIDALTRQLRRRPA